MWLRLAGLDRTSLFGDEAVYSGQAAALAGDAARADSFGIFLAHPVLFQLLLGAGFLGGLPDEGGRILTALFGVGTVGLGWLIARSIGGRALGSATGLLLARSRLRRLPLTPRPARWPRRLCGRGLAVRLPPSRTRTLGNVVGHLRGDPRHGRPHEGIGGAHPACRGHRGGRGLQATARHAGLVVRRRRVHGRRRCISPLDRGGRRTRLDTDLPPLSAESARSDRFSHVSPPHRSVLRLAVRRSCGRRLRRRPAGWRRPADRRDLGVRPDSDPPSMGTS